MPQSLRVTGKTIACSYFHALYFYLLRPGAAAVAPPPPLLGRSLFFFVCFFFFTFKEYNTYVLRIYQIIRGVALAFETWWGARAVCYYLWPWHWYTSHHNTAPYHILGAVDGIRRHPPQSIFIHFRSVRDKIGKIYTMKSRARQPQPHSHPPLASWSIQSTILLHIDDMPHKNVFILPEVVSVPWHLHRIIARWTSAAVRPQLTAKQINIISEDRREDESDRCVPVPSAAPIPK